jgi:basic membrane protein A
MATRHRTLTGLALVLCMALAACGDRAAQQETETAAAAPTDQEATGATSEAPSEEQDESFVVWAPLSGNLGDRSFMDSANRGIERAADELGAEIRVIPASTNDPPAWERNIREAAGNADVDIVVTGGTVVASTLEAIAPDFPDVDFLIFDAPSSGPNVTGITYAQNEGAFLAGALAALITTNPELFPNATGSNRVGLCTGQDIPVIQDFITGFRQGVAHIDPNVEVDVRFTNDFVNPQKGFEFATAMFNDGADVVYQVAGPTGLGILEAAEASGRYGIGTDSNQNDLHPGFIAASAIKSVDNTVFEALQEAADGSLAMGETRVGNLANDGVDLEVDPEIVPEQIAAQIEDIKERIRSGEIVVDSALD